MQDSSYVYRPDIRPTEGHYPGGVTGVCGMSGIKTIKVQKTDNSGIIRSQLVSPDYGGSYPMPNVATNSCDVGEDRKSVRIDSVSISKNVDLQPKKALDRLDAKQTMAEISIPGMRVIFGRKAHIARRITWMLILLVCTAIAAVQVITYIKS